MFAVQPLLTRIVVNSIAGVGLQVVPDRQRGQLAGLRKRECHTKWVDANVGRDRLATKLQQQPQGLVDCALFDFVRLDQRQVHAHIQPTRKLSKVKSVPPDCNHVGLLHRTAGNTF